MPANHTLITLSDPRAPAAEAYRSLRTNLMFTAIDDPLRTLVITSPTADAAAAEKSITIANLAITMAQSGRQTLLVDCDLRRPSQHKIWEIPSDPGLTTLLLEGGELSAAEVGVENLAVLPSGPLPLNPADLIGSRKMEDLIERLKAEAEVILFDAPPVLAVTDAAVLASKVDGVLLALTAGRTRRDHAARAKELLEKVNIRILGAVLNSAPVDASLGGY